MSIRVVAKKKVLDTVEGGEKLFEIIKVEAPTANQVPTFYRTGYPCVFSNLKGHLLVWSADKFWELTPGELVTEATMNEINKIIQRASRRLEKAKCSLSCLRQKWHGEVTFVDGKER